MNNLWQMQKRFRKSGLVLFTLILISGGMLLLSGSCRNNGSAVPSNEFKNETFDENTYINFRSFQNPDLTWGFTIFINSEPFRQYNEIPFKDAHGGFVSRTEAEKVANFFIKMIRNGESSPKLNKRSLDTLGITINTERMPD